MALRVEELAATSDLSVDTVRYYQSQGLLHGPVRDGRIAWYDSSHVERLGEIRQLSEQGFSLAQIRALSENDDPLLRSLVTGAGGSAEVPTLDREALSQRSGLDQASVALAIEIGLLSPAVVDGQERFGSDAVDMLNAARLLIDSGIDPTAFTELAVRHASHTEQLADDAIALVHDLISARGLSRDDAASMIEVAVPRIVDLVAGHFRQTLISRATARLVYGGESL